MDSKKDIITKEALKDAYNQIKNKKTFLIMPVSGKRIGELTAASLTKSGIVGNFVLYTDIKNFHLILIGISSGYFKGLSFEYHIRESSEIKGIRHIKKLKIMDAILSPKPCNPECLINKKSKDLIADTIIEELENAI